MEVALSDKAALWCSFCCPESLACSQRCDMFELHGQGFQESAAGAAESI